MPKPYRNVSDLTQVGGPFPPDTEAVVVVLTRLAAAIEANTAMIAALREDFHRYRKWAKKQNRRGWRGRSA